MHADTTTGVPIMFVKASEILEPEGTENFTGCGHRSALTNKMVTCSVDF